ncbi:hypothetical protein HY441_01750 [Candidatus Microgenomates bacterium]|nr:hypothetical protein [Candidatus Microgenomates bacterium]
MIGVGHTSVGALIGVAVAALPTTLPLWQRLLAVTILGVASHYGCDLIPHGHYNFDVKRPTARSSAMLIIDVIGSAALILWLAYLYLGISSGLLLVLTAIIAALLPDIWENLVTLKIIPNHRWVKLHRRFHMHIIHWHNHRTSLGRFIPRRLALTDTYLVALLALAVVSISSF